MFERFTDAARAVIVRSEQLAGEARAGVIGEEHLLLALLERLHEPEPGWSLASSLPVLRESAPQLRPSESVPAGQKRLAFTPQVKTCLQLALKESLTLGSNYVGREHLLLGVLRTAGDAPSTVLTGLLVRADINPVTARQDVLSALAESDQQRTARDKQREEAVDAQRRDPALCVFCRIVDGQDESSRVYEDDQVVAFLGVIPINLGHVLIVPRQHLPYLADVGEDLGAHMYRIGHRVAAALRQSGLPCAGVGMTIADGASAGQEIFHSHLHVYPRNPGDGYRINAMWWLRERTDLNRAAEQIRGVLATTRV